MTYEVDPIIKAVEVKKSFGGNDVLRGIDFDVLPGELTHVTGQSGSGKTTLLNLISGLDVPSSGSVLHGEVDLNGLNADELTEWRAQYAGFVFQHSGLLGGLSVRDNILTPDGLKDRPVGIDKSRAGLVVARLGLTSLLDRKARKLSGGEKQRVALARALIHGPEIVFADEPTASLDTRAKVEFSEMLRGIVDEAGVTVVLVSHDEATAGFAHRTVEMKDGLIVSDSGTTRQQPALLGSTNSFIGSDSDALVPSSGSNASCSVIAHNETYAQPNVA